MILWNTLNLNSAFVVNKSKKGKRQREKARGNDFLKCGVLLSLLQFFLTLWVLTSFPSLGLLSGNGLRSPWDKLLLSRKHALLKNEDRVK